MFTYQYIILYVNLIAPPELAPNCQMFIFTWNQEEVKYLGLWEKWCLSIITKKEKNKIQRNKTSPQSLLEDYHLKNSANLQIKISVFVAVE